MGVARQRPLPHLSAEQVDMSVESAGMLESDGMSPAANNVSPIRHESDEESVRWEVSSQHLAVQPARNIILLPRWRERLIV